MCRMSTGKKVAILLTFLPILLSAFQDNDHIGALHILE